MVIGSCVVLLSGGMDSATILRLLAQDRDVLPLAVMYGQRHSKELAAAATIASKMGIHLETVSAQIDPAPMRGGVVIPGRNLALISLAVAHALRRGAQSIAIGAHADDAPTFPDCRLAFLDVAHEATMAGYDIATLAPLARMTKREIVILGKSLGVDYRDTWTCYEGGASHCGACLACIGRRRAFSDAGVVDPTEWAT